MKPGFSVVIVARAPSGRYGVFRQDGIPFAVTLERTFDDGAGGQRCVIPSPGVVHCVRDHYNKGGYVTFQLLVEGHDRVLFHILNVETQSEACMGIGESFATFNDAAKGLIGPGIAQSGEGFAEFMRRTAGLQAFDLTMLEAEAFDD